MIEIMNDWKNNLISPMGEQVHGPRMSLWDMRSNDRMRSLG